MANFAAIDAAIAAGTVATTKQATMNVTLRLAGGRSVKLVGGDGEATPEGEHYYAQLGINPPAAFPYKQRILQGKWVVGFDRKKHLVQRLKPDGTWAVTPKGADFFKHNQDSYTVKYPVRQIWASSGAEPFERGPERDAAGNSDLYDVQPDAADTYMSASDPGGEGASLRRASPWAS